MKDKDKTVKVVNNQGATGFVLFVAFIGAAVYFIQQTDGRFWPIVLALLKAIVWPAYVVYHGLQLMHA